MKRTPRVIAAVQFMLGLLVGFVTWASKYQSPPNAPDSIAAHVLPWIRDHAAVLTFILAGLVALTALAKEWPGTYGFRRSTVEKLLDQFAREQFKGRAKHHRLTLYKDVTGQYAYWVGRWRLMRRAGDVARKRAALEEIDRGMRYLHVYARASEARNRRSTAAWRISDRKEECEGIAGLAWEESFCVAPNLPKLGTGELSGVTSLASLDERDARREYAIRANVRNEVILRAMDTYARHYMATVVLVNGKPWGVLVLDSEASECPFTANSKGGMVGKQFKAFAKQLSHVLS